jgi:hypothetical protein
MKLTITILTLTAALLMIMIPGCRDLDPATPPGVNTGTADFTRYVALGSGNTAGYQSGGLVEKFQEVSYPALLAHAARAATFEFPAVSEPGRPPLMFVKSLAPVQLDTLDGLGVPTNLNYAGIYNNLGVPGAFLSQILNATPAEPTNPFFGLVLRNPALGMTVLEQARNLQPTIATVWIGNYDVLYSILKGTDQLMTPASAFLSRYAELIDSLLLSCDDIVAANIPYLTTVPYVTTVPPVVVDPLTRQPVLHPVTGELIPLIGVVQGVPGPLPLSARVLLPATAYMAQGIGIPSALPGGTGLPLADSLILDATEWTAIDDRIDEFNMIIGNICAVRDIPVVDLNAFFLDVFANGVEIRGDTYGFGFITGGLFSLDGVHLSMLGQYIVANEFISTINAAFDADIPETMLPYQPR